MIAYAPLPERRDVSVDCFQQDIIPAGKPVVLRDFVKNWELVKAADRGVEDVSKLLKDAADSKIVNVMSGHPEIEGRFFYDESMKGFNYQNGQMRFSNFIEAILKNEMGGSLYMGSNPLPNVMPSLVDMCPMPFVPAGVIPRIWVGTNSVVSTHYDTDYNVACVIAGTRRFTLFPPSQIANLYPGPIEHNMAGPQVSLPNPENPDLKKFPKYEMAMQSGRQAELSPGDAIYIPPLWWHHVRAIGNLNVLMNYWWSPTPQYSREPLEALVLSLLAIRQLPDSEREAWKNLFDYFIFQTDGPPMGHLPDEISGVLGPHSQQQSIKIWSFFKNLMR